ncbi:MAG: type I restriction-modification enzyme R subunit C-terminal domain-containing protein [Prevotella sp.]|nr:type I restriction-modification enzyme R subunit C-terminal domain-containing protein [Prevotella sp.]
MGISKDLTEEDIKFRYINEAITSKGWSKDSIFMEQKVKFTDGKISLHGNLVHREKPKFADYVLYANKATPIAIVDMDDVDDFDFICHIAYGKKTLTRHERAEQVKKREIMKLIRHWQRYSVSWGLK